MNLFLLTAWLTCQSFDAGSTAYSLSHGFREANPLMARGHVPVRVSVNLLAVWAYRKTKAKAIPVALAVSGCAAGVWNVHQVRTR